MKEFDVSDINQDTVQVHFDREVGDYNGFKKRCRETAPLPSHATYFTTSVDATLSYQNGDDKIKYYVTTYPYNENEHNIYLKSNIGTTHKIPKWKLWFKNYDRFLKDCMDIMKQDVHAYQEKNTLRTNNDKGTVEYQEGRIMEKDFDNNPVDEREQEKQAVRPQNETVTKNFDNFNEEDFDYLCDMVFAGEEGPAVDFAYKGTKYLLESVPSLDHPGEMDVRLIPYNPDISITRIPSNQFKACDYHDFMSLAKSIAETDHRALNTSHHVAYHLDPIDSIKSKTGEKISDALAKSFLDKVWSITLPGQHTKEYDAVYFSATRNGSYLEFKRNPEPAATVAGKTFILEGSLRDCLFHDMIETLKAVGTENNFLPIPKRLEKVSVFSDQTRINYYVDAVQDKIQDIVKNGATAKDLEHQALQALKKDDYYRPDQYTGTTKEDKALRSILHQEIESMKRRGLLKENVQTGALSVSKARDQEASR